VIIKSDSQAEEEIIDVKRRSNIVAGRGAACANIQCVAGRYHRADSLAYAMCGDTVAEVGRDALVAILCKAPCASSITPSIEALI